MPNWSEPDEEFPSRETVRQLEEKERLQRRIEVLENQKIQRYLDNHPSASWAEAEYKTR